MKTTITGRHVVVSLAQRAAIRKKLERVRRVLNDAALSAQVVVFRDGALTVCELIVHARGDHTLHGKGRDRRFSIAWSAATARVVQQAKKLAGRWKSRRRGSGA